MIQRRVKWKEGVTVENGSVQTRKSLGKAERLPVGGHAGSGWHRGFCCLLRGLERQSSRAAVKSWRVQVRLPAAAQPITGRVTSRTLFNRSKPQLLRVV